VSASSDLFPLVFTLGKLGSLYEGGQVERSSRRLPKPIVVTHKWIFMCFINVFYAASETLPQTARGSAFKPSSWEPGGTDMKRHNKKKGEFKSLGRWKGGN